MLSLEQLVEVFDLRRVNKANAVVDRGRLDFFNGAHIKRLFAAAPPTPTTPPRSAAATDTAPPRTRLYDLLEQVAPLLDAALGRLAAATAPAGGAVAMTHDHTPPSLAGVTRVSDVPDAPASATALGSGGGGGAVDTTTAAEVAALGGGRGGGGGCGRGGGGVLSRFQRDHLLAVLRAQHERVHVFPEFVPLVLPFVAGEAEFRAWLLAQAGTAAFDPVVAQLTKAAGAAAGGIAPPSAAPPSPLTVDVGAQWKARVAPHLRAVADAWEALPSATAPPTTSTGRGAPAPVSLAAAEGDTTAALIAGMMAAFKTVAAEASAAAGGAPLRPAAIMLPARFALTGMDVGASLSDTLRLLGRDACVARLRWAADWTPGHHVMP